MRRIFRKEGEGEETGEREGDTTSYSVFHILYFNNYVFAIQTSCMYYNFFFISSPLVFGFVSMMITWFFLHLL